MNGAFPFVMRYHMPGSLDNFLNSECLWNAEGVLANVGYLVKEIRGALSRRQECGTTNLRTKETRQIFEAAISG